MGSKTTEDWDSMADRLYPKGNGISLRSIYRNGHVRLDCGCLGWSEARPDLVVCWCAEHQAKLQADSETMRARAVARRQQELQFNRNQVQRNVDRLRDR